MSAVVATPLTSAGPSSSNPYYHVDKILDRPGPSTIEHFAAGNAVKEFLRATCKILVIGAGGLGCEILQNLALLGFGDVHVIDMDTIDVSNLNRQFLFRQKDVGRPKATVAAEFVMQRVPGCKVTPYFGKIQDKDEDYYMQFNLIICGLDSVPARRWINATVISMVDEDNPESLKVLIDGEQKGLGFKGQSRIIVPMNTSCYECSLDMFTPQTAFPICTIANTPRLPEHCIEWASVLEWPRLFKDKKIDGDDPEHIQWLFDTASARADKYKIVGVTWSLTQGVVKNIIPAIASTNAIIAASCCNEAFKVATNSAPAMDNYMMYTGTDSVYTYTFKHEANPECPVCGGETLVIKRPKDTLLQQVLDFLAEEPKVQLKTPSIMFGGRMIFMQAPAQLRKSTEPNLDKTLGQLFGDAQEGEIVLTVTDPTLPLSLNLQIDLE